MAEQISQDVVNEAQSMGDPSPIDAPATTTTISSSGNGQAAPETAITDSKPSDEPAPPSLIAPTTEASAVDGSGPSDNAQGDDEDHSAHDGTESQPVESSDPVAEPLANGDSGDYFPLDDGAREPAGADTSGGSDTEASRGDSTDQTGEGPRRHFRSNSVKKPASFKSVSVTKNFLAKSGASTPSAKAGDRSSPIGQANSSAQQVAKPRLVAKAGSGLSVPRSGLSKANGAGGAPDASKVWNKNRPAPAPPVKSLTDEELKQQYGIHMATRLQADEASKDPKWADIEDDEDDWAPETVEWMDGTKSTLAAAENQAPPKQETPKPTEKEKPAETPKPSLVSAQRPSATGGTKTILKPGNHTPATQTKPGGLVLKGAPEKPTLVAKPSAPVPAKSPWAPLPPIDKVSPIAPPVQPPPPSRFSQRDPHGFDALPPAPSPAKEIAADDFSRSWRDDRGTKELFNSQSGRYEPVSETRRGPMRYDGGFRQPSVLQRPQQGQPGPAEPSAAFQTNRASNVPDGAMWTRRRTSSNVSGGSGQARRMSFGRLYEGISMPLDPLQRRTSHQFSAGDAGRPGFSQERVAPPERGISPAGSQGLAQQSPPVANRAQPASPSGSATPSATVGTDSPGPETPLPVPEDPVVVQQRLMREKIERAKKGKERRKEEEEKEEAARKERLRLKLAALGPPPEQKPKRKETPDVGTPAEEVKPSPSPVKQTLDQPPAPQEEPAPSSPKPSIATIQTIPSEVTQYGLLKVHQPHAIKPPATSPEASIKTSSNDLPLPPQTSQSPAQNIPSSSYPIQSSSLPPQSSSHPTQQREMAPQMEVQLPSSALQHDPLVKSQAELHRDIYNPWGGSGMAGPMPAGGNVWGAPSRDRALGNGTFELPMQSQQPLPQQRPTPRPIAPPHSQKVSPQATQVSSAPLKNLQQQAPVAPRVESRPHQATQQAAISGQATLQAPAGPGPIGRPLTGSATRNDVQSKKYSTADWGNLPTQLATNEKEIADKNRAERAEAEKLRAAGARLDYDLSMQETFKKTNVADNRKTLKSDRLVHETEAARLAREVKAKSDGEANAIPPQPQVTPKAAQDDMATVASLAPKNDSNVVQPAATGAHSQAPHNVPSQRGSRYFSRAPDALPSQPSPSSTKSDSPPPPDSQDHPVYEGSSGVPKVNLPIPKAVVKLPPAPTPAPKPAQPPVRVQPVRIGSQAIVKSEEWMSRIHGLFKKPAQPVQAPVSPPTQAPAAGNALPVSSATKPSLEVTTLHAPTTVSLPVQGSGAKASKLVAFVDNTDAVISKPTEEELHNDREFGSTPTVRIPKNQALYAHVDTMSRPMPLYMKSPRPVDVSTAESVALIENWVTPQGISLKVRLPGQLITKTVTMPRPTNGNGRKASGFNRKKNFSPREGGNNQPNAHGPRKPQGSRTTWAKPPRGNSSSQANSAWNARPSGIVH